MFIHSDPRNNAMRHGLIVKEREPFSVRPKFFWDVTQAGALLAPKFANSLAHEPDGLIFQPSLDVSLFIIWGWDVRTWLACGQRW